MEFFSRSKNNPITVKSSLKKFKGLFLGLYFGKGLKMRHCKDFNSYKCSCIKSSSVVERAPAKASRECGAFFVLFDACPELV